MTGGDIDKASVARAYSRWAPVYDLVFGRVFAPGRAASIAAAERVGGRILDVGVGTGIALPDYKPTNRITAVDYSEAMLRKARTRVIEQKLDHVECVAVMDAQELGFADLRQLLFIKSERPDRPGGADFAAEVAFIVAKTFFIIHFRLHQTRDTEVGK